MIIVMKMSAEQEQVDAVLDRVRELGYQPHLSGGTERR